MLLFTHSRIRSLAHSLSRCLALSLPRSFAACALRLSSAEPLKDRLAHVSKSTVRALCSAQVSCAHSLAPFITGHTYCLCTACTHLGWFHCIPGACVGSSTDSEDSVVCWLDLIQRARSAVLTADAAVSSVPVGLSMEHSPAENSLDGNLSHLSVAHFQVAGFLYPSIWIAPCTSCGS
jgi:hypothetical protein